jgi:hypothetical protein
MEECHFLGDMEKTNTTRWLEHYLSEWHFLPGTVDGKPTTGELTLVFRFSQQDVAQSLYFQPPSVDAAALSHIVVDLIFEPSWQKWGVLFGDRPLLTKSEAAMRRP